GAPRTSIATDSPALLMVRSSPVRTRASEAGSKSHHCQNLLPSGVNTQLFMFSFFIRGPCKISRRDDRLTHIRGFRGVEWRWLAFFGNFVVSGDELRGFKDLPFVVSGIDA